MSEVKRNVLDTDASGFVLLTDIIKDVILDIRYYSTYNFLGERVDGYEEPLALLTKEAAEALKKVSDEAMKLGYRLKIFDCYRPQMAVDHFVRWAEEHRNTIMKEYFYPEVDKKNLFELGFVALKSGHSRGSTVDLTLFDMATQKDIDMGGTFDYFGYLSWAQIKDEITEKQAENRKLLRDLMLGNGFKPLKEEWWHFTLENEPYPDTYFTFPINSDQVKSRNILSEKLKDDMELRLRLYDALSTASENSRELLQQAIRKAVKETIDAMDSFSEREYLEVDESRLQEAVNELTHSINEAVLKMFK